MEAIERTSMSEPNWPAWVKDGTWLYWCANIKEYVLSNKEPYIMNFTPSMNRKPELQCDYANICMLDPGKLHLVTDHDWQIPEEPDPLKRKWRKE